VQHVNSPGEAHGVDGAVGVAVEVVNDLQHARPAEALQRLGVRRLVAELGIPQGSADPPPNVLGECPQVVLTAADPAHRLGPDIAGALRRMPDLRIYACSGIISSGFPASIGDEPGEEAVTYLRQSS